MSNKDFKHGALGSITCVPGTLITLVMPDDITWLDVYAIISRQLFTEFSSRTRNVSEGKMCVSNMLKELSSKGS